jgi:hypothetical protein
MPRATAKSRRRRILWTAGDVRLLKSSARRQPVAKIARALRRTEAAVRFKANTLKISLALKKR